LNHRHEIVYRPIGHVRSQHTQLEGMPLQTVADDQPATIDLDPELTAGLADLDGFSHIYILSHLHHGGRYSLAARPFLDDQPRGLFATRAPRRPNPIGLSLARLLRVEPPRLVVEGIDLLDGTPILDIKPFVPLFDCAGNARTGWLEHRAHQVMTKRADDRFQPEP
jgi:tRNA-Thr(GGU) m(6)t(6)A37 methyltransferase TsaA